MEKIGVKMAGTFSIVKQVKDPVNLRCDQCNKTFTRSWLLKNHQRIHTGERPYQCVYCDKAFADKSNLRQHAKIHTTKEKLFQCTVCQKTFAQRRYLMKHATEIHREMSMTILGRVATKSQMPKLSGPMKYVVQQPPTKVRALVDLRDSKESGSGRGKGDSKQADSKSGESTSTEAKDKKYSEQDLKDFIKSNQKTMEKNGYIFIKQNFETLDTDAEPTLTEISEIPVSSIPDSLKIGAAESEKKTGNQFLKVNGKMVYLQMDNKPATREEILEATKAKKDDTSGTNSKGKVGKSETPGKILGLTATKGSGKKVLAKNTYIRRQANILKTNPVKKTTLQVPESGTNVSGKQASVPNIVKNVMNAVSPVQMLTMNSATGRPENAPLTYVQLVPSQQQQQQQQQQQNRPIIIPLSEIQPINIAQIINNSGMIRYPVTTSVGANSSNLQNIKATSVNNLHLESGTSNGGQHGMFASDPGKPEIVEIQEIPAMDEKGAAGDLGQSSVVANTPIVSDAPWQGVLNINSEQELLEYINSQSNTSVDSDQGYTILIQNVDSQNSAVMSAGLDSQSILTGSGHLSNVFTEQGAMMADILPVVSSDETQANTSTDSEMISPDLEEDEQTHMSGSETNVVVISGENFNTGESDSEYVADGHEIKVEEENGSEETITVHINNTDEESDFENEETNTGSDIPEEAGEEHTVEMMFTATREGLQIHESVDSPDQMSGQLLIKEESENEMLQENTTQESMESDDGSEAHE